MTIMILPEWHDRVLGAVSHGETYVEAIKNGREALQALIASAQKQGESLPTSQVVIAA
jgi:predicted RNase H-like HicB family nuclease